MRCNLDGSKHGSVSRIDILSLALSFPTYRLDLASNRRLHASRCAIAQDLLILSIDMGSNCLPSADLHFIISDIQTTIFPIFKFDMSLKRRFFVSVTDGTTRITVPVAIKEGCPLHWKETLDGFVLGPSSQLTLQIFKKRNLHSDKLIATFVIPCENLRSSPGSFLVQNDMKNKYQSAEILVTWSQCRPPSDTILPLPSEEVERARLQFQDAKESAEKMKHLSESATGVVNASENVGPVLDTTVQVVTSVQRFLDKCKIVGERLDFVVGAVDTIVEIHPYAKMAWSVIVFIPKKISDQIQLDRDVMDLLDEMETALDLAPDPKTLRSRCKQSDKHEKTLIRLLEQIEECGRFIQSYVEDEGFWERFRKNFFSKKRTVVDSYRQVLSKLHGSFLGQVIVTVESNIFLILAEVKAINENVKEFGKDITELMENMKDIEENIKEIDLDLQLEKLQYGRGTQFDSNKRCLPETRVKFLNAIMDWVNDPGLSSPNVLVLFGQAGTGKSSIANEVALRYSRMNRLTTSYFFARGYYSGREPYLFFTTLARDLCKIWPAFKVALWKLIKKKPELASTYNYTTLVESLLQGPLGGLFFVGPVFIVIDALDENEDASRELSYTGNNSIPFHTALSQFVSKLPSNFRILITSRRETELEEAFPESLLVRHMYMDDHELADQVGADIRIYMGAELGNTDIPRDTIPKLVKKAEGLFQWASVACRYIAHPPPGLDSGYCLATILYPSQPNTPGHLDKLYSTVLKARFDMANPQICRNFRSIMTQVLGTLEPLSITSLNILRQYMPAETTVNCTVSAVVKHMGSLLSNVAPSTSTLPIAPLHTSFRDFLTDESAEFYINLDNAHDDFAIATLRMMQNELKFNICKLERSYLLKSEVPDLEERIKKSISPALWYSCRFWAEHLAHVSKFDRDLFSCLRVLMEEKFLFWLEVLNVKGQLALARRALLSLQMWLDQMRDKIKGMDNFDVLINDAIAFTQYCYPTQHPIFESAQNALIFGAAWLETPRFLDIRSIYNAGGRKMVEMDGGFASGVFRGSIWAVRPVGALPRDSDVLIKVEETLPSISHAVVTCPGNIKVEFGCFEVSHSYGDAALNILLDDQDPRFGEFLLLVHDHNVSGALKIVQEVLSWDVRLVFIEKRSTVAEGDMVPQLGVLGESTCVALSPDGRLLLPPTTDFPALCEYLRKLARYKFGVGLRNLDKHNNLCGKLSLELKWRESGSSRYVPWKPAPMGEDGFPLFHSGDQIACVIRNNSDVKVWLYVLEFAEDGSVMQRYPGRGGEEQLAPGSSTKEVAQMQLGISSQKAFQLAECEAVKEKEGNCQQQVTEVMKLFASTERIDLSLLLQTPFVYRESCCGLSSLLHKEVDEDNIPAWETVNAPFVLEFGT